MTEEELLVIEKRANSATPGPWRKYGLTIVARGKVRVAEFFSGQANNEQRQADMVFIWNARTDIPVLVAEIRRLREQRKVLAEELTMACELFECDDETQAPDTDAFAWLHRAKLALYDLVEFARLADVAVNEVAILRNQNTDLLAEGDALKLRDQMGKRNYKIP